MFDYQYWLIF